MATATDHKTVGGPGYLEEKVVRVLYDFAEDGGAQGAFDLLTADGAILITGFGAHVIDAVTSGSNPTVDVGVSGGDTDVFMDGVAKGALTDNATFGPELVETEGTPNAVVSPIPLRLADAGKITMTVGSADLTAGKIEFIFKVMRAFD